MAYRIVVPHFLDGAYFLRQASYFLMGFFVIEGDGFLAQSLQRQKVLDAAIGASFLVVGKVVFEQDALLADLTQVKAAIQHRQEVLGGRSRGGGRHRMVRGDDRGRRAQ